MARDPAEGTRQASSPRDAQAPRAPWEDPHWEDRVRRDARTAEASARATVKRAGLLMGLVLLLACAGSLWAIYAAATGTAPDPVPPPTALYLIALVTLAVAAGAAGVGILALSRQTRRLSRLTLELAETQRALVRGAIETAEIARGLRHRFDAVASPAGAHPHAAPVATAAAAAEPAGGFDRLEPSALAALRRAGVHTLGDLLFWEPRALAGATGIPAPTLEALQRDAARALTAGAMRDGAARSGVPP